MIYLFAHSGDGAMGLATDKRAENPSFNDLLDQLEIPAPQMDDAARAHYEGPVGRARIRPASQSISRPKTRPCRRPPASR